MNTDTAFADTCLFFLGVVIGSVLDMIFDRRITGTPLEKRHHFLWIGAIQIMANAYVIRFVRNRVGTIGLLILGLLSTQTLVIRKGLRPDKEDKK